MEKDHSLLQFYDLATITELGDIQTSPEAHLVKLFQEISPLQLAPDNETRLDISVKSGFKAIVDHIATKDGVSSWYIQPSLCRASKPYEAFERDGSTLQSRMLSIGAGGQKGHNEWKLSLTLLALSDSRQEVITSKNGVLGFLHSRNCPEGQIVQLITGADDKVTVEPVDETSKYLVLEEFKKAVEQLSGTPYQTADSVKLFPAETDLSETSIDELLLDTRTYNRLNLASIKTIGALCNHAEYELMSIPSFGPVSLRGVVDALAEKSLSLRADE